MSFPNPFSATDGIIANGTFTANSTQVVANNITASTLTSNGISGNNINSQAISSITSDNSRNAIYGRHGGTATGVLGQNFGTGPGGAFYANTGLGLYSYSVSGVSALFQANSGTTIAQFANLTAIVASVDISGNFRQNGSQVCMAGEVKMVAFTTVPAGWLECNGQTFSAVAYPALFAAIGSTTVPDLRGCFPRGFDNGRGLDYGRSINTYQADAAQDHLHSSGSLYFNGGGFSTSVYGVATASTYVAFNYTVPAYPGAPYGQWGLNYSYNNYGPTLGTQTGYIGSWFNSQAFGMTSSGTTSVSGAIYNNTGAMDRNGGVNETRPKNVALMFIIKT